MDPEQQLATLKLIDLRQRQLIEDLDRLNVRIENIIELYTNNRSELGIEPLEGDSEKLSVDGDDQSIDTAAAA